MDIIKTLGFSSLVALGLAGCAGAKPAHEQQAAARAAAQESIDQILSTPLETADYTKPERCISSFDYDELEILDDQHVLFKGTGDRMWLNTLRMRCVGLRENSTPVIRLRSSQLCDLDTFQGVDTGIWTRTSGTCSLGEFVPVTPEQAKGIEAAIKETRQRKKAP